MTGSTIRLPEIHRHKGSFEVHNPEEVILAGWRSLDILGPVKSALRSEPDLSSPVDMLLSLCESLISSAAVEALREGSEGNVPECGPHDAASFFGRHCSERQSHKKHVSSETVACQRSVTAAWVALFVGKKYQRNRTRKIDRDNLARNKQDSSLDAQQERSTSFVVTVSWAISSLPHRDKEANRFMVLLWLCCRTPWSSGWRYELRYLVCLPWPIGCVINVDAATRGPRNVSCNAKLQWGHVYIRSRCCADTCDHSTLVCWERQKGFCH